MMEWRPAQDPECYWGWWEGQLQSGCSIAGVRVRHTCVCCVGLLCAALVNCKGQGGVQGLVLCLAPGLLRRHPRQGQGGSGEVRVTSAASYNAVQLSFCNRLATSTAGHGMFQ